MCHHVANENIGQVMKSGKESKTWQKEGMKVKSMHIAEAIGYRNLDRGDWAERGI